MSGQLNYDAYVNWNYLATYQSAGKARAAIFRQTDRFPSFYRGCIVVTRWREELSRPARTVRLARK